MKLAKYMLSKTILNNKKTFISLVLISALGICLLTALLNTYHGVGDTFVQFFEEYHYPDVTVIAEAPFTRDMVDGLQEMDGVEEVQFRLALDSNAVYKDEVISLRCYSADEEDLLRYHTMSALQDRQFEDVIPMKLESRFVELAGFELGEEFELSFGDSTYRCVFSDIVMSPECVVVYRDKDFDIYTDEFGYAFFPYEELKSMAGIPADLYNQVLIKTEEGVLAEDVEQEIRDSGIFPSAIYSYTYENSPHKIFVDDCIAPLKAVSYILSFTFFLITIVMIYLFMYQMIMEQKEKIGVLMALGASPDNVAAIYYTYGLVIAVLAGVVGNVSGYFLTLLLGKIYQKTFSLPYMNLKYDWVYTAVSLVIIVAVVLLAISFAAAHIFRLDPAEAMKSHLSAKTDVRQPRYMKYIGYAQKVCILCGLRNKRRLALSYVSTILTVTLIMFAFQYSDAGNYVSEHTYTERFLYDVQVLFDEALPEDEAMEMMAHADTAERYELFSRASVQIESGDTRMDTTLYGISENSSIVHLYGAKREKLSLASEGIVLARNAAEELQVSKGDTVLVNDIPLTVTGIHEENIFFVQYCNLQVFEEIAGNEFHGANVVLKEGTQYHKLYDALKDQTGFGYLSKKTSQQEGVENRLEKSAIAVYVLIIMAFIAGFTIIYNMSVINFKERVRVFSVMMAIGTDISKIAGATFLELLVQYIVSVIVGSLIGIYAGKILLYAASTNNIQYQTALSEVSLLWMAVCVAAFMLLGHMMALKNLKEMDIVEILKTRE